MKKFFLFGSILMALAVILGAFGAHGLEEILIENQRLDTYETAVKYHFYHALGLILIGTIAGYIKDNMNLVFYFMIFGVLIFSGSLYTLSITNIKWLGAITPIGGLLFISAWILLALKVAKSFND